MSKVKFADFMSAVISDAESLGHRRPLRTLTQAADDQQNHALIRQVLAMAKRFGCSSILDDNCDPVALDRELKASGRATTEEKIRLKTLLAMIGVLR